MRLAVCLLVLVSNGLNELADGGRLDAIIRRINGRLNGRTDRLTLRAKVSAGWRDLALAVRKAYLRDLDR